MENIVKNFNEIDREILKKPLDSLNEVELLLEKSRSENNILEENICKYFLSSIYVVLGKYNKALDLLMITSDYFDNRSQKYYEAKVNSLIATVHSRTYNYVIAIEFSKKAFQGYREINDFDGMTYCYAKIGTLYCDLDNIKEMHYYIDLAKYNVEGVKSQFIKSSIYTNISYAYVKLEKWEKALEYSIKGLNIEKKLRGNIKEINPNENIYYNNIGEIYTELGKYQLAEKNLLTSIEIASRNNNTFLLEDSYKQISNLYEKTYRPNKALESFKKHSKYKEIVIEEITNRKNEELIADYENEKKLREAEIFKLKNIELKEQTIALEHSKDRLRVINEIGKTLTSAEHVEKCYDIFSKGLFGILNTRYIAIGLVSDDKKSIRYDYAVDKGFPMLPWSNTLENDKNYSSVCYSIGKDILIGVENHDISEDLIEATKNIEIKIPAEDGSVKSGIFCLLKARNEKIGILLLESSVENNFNEDDYETIKSLASYLAISIDNARKSKALELLSVIDPLTGLKNRRYLDQIESKKIEKISVGTVYGDINKFKEINDNHGHLAGDQCIKIASQILMDSVNKEDIIIRMGGDEFMIIQFDTSVDKLMKIIAAINEKCLKTKIEYGELSISLGYGFKAECNGGKDIQELYQVAEEKMYESKREYHKES